MRFIEFKEEYGCSLWYSYLLGLVLTHVPCNWLEKVIPDSMNWWSKMNIGLMLGSSGLIFLLERGHNMHLGASIFSPNTFKHFKHIQLIICPKKLIICQFKKKTLMIWSPGLALGANSKYINALLMARQLMIQYAADLHLELVPSREEWSSSNTFTYLVLKD